MPPNDSNASRARAEALFKPPQQQPVHAAGATAEYRAAQRAALERMHELRRLRLARDAKLSGRTS